jgi:hypothetical protein
MHASRINLVISRDSRGIVETAKESFFEEIFLKSSRSLILRLAHVEYTYPLSAKFFGTI